MARKMTASTGFGHHANAAATESPATAVAAPSMAMAAVFTDSMRVCPALATVRTLSAHTPTWAYDFADRTAPWLPPVTFPTGAYHGAEVMYAGKPHIDAAPRDKLIREFRRGVLVGLKEVPRVGGPRDKQLPARALLEVLNARHDDVVRFCYDTRIPPTNNLAERDLRPQKIQQPEHLRPTHQRRRHLQPVDGPRPTCPPRPSTASTCSRSCATRSSAEHGPPGADMTEHTAGRPYPAMTFGKGWSLDDPDPTTRPPSDDYRASVLVIGAITF